MEMVNPIRLSGKMQIYPTIPSTGSTTSFGEHAYSGVTMTVDTLTKLGLLAVENHSRTYSDLGGYLDKGPIVDGSVGRV